MKSYFIKHKEKEIQFAPLDVFSDGNVEVAFINCQLPGKWVYNAGRTILKRIDIETVAEYEVIVKQVCNLNSDESLFGKLKKILDSQTTVAESKEYWSRVKYEVVEDEDGSKSIVIPSHKVAFYFGSSGEFKGMGICQ